MTLQELETEIRREIQAAQAEGWRIEPQCWLDRFCPDDLLCCALGATIRNEAPAPVYEAEYAVLVAARLGVDLKWVWSFVQGFDANELSHVAVLVPEAFQLGQRLKWAADNELRMTSKDADFIALARSAMPRLIEEVKRLREDRRRLIDGSYLEPCECEKYRVEPSDWNFGSHHGLGMEHAPARLGGCKRGQG